MFNYEIKYEKGSTEEADMLSRSPVSENISHHVHELLDFDEIKELQNKEKLIVYSKKNY